MEKLTTEIGIEAVLRAEAKSIHDRDIGADISGKELNQELNSLNASALCLSGGGIRSAAFSLGIIQALAVHPRSAEASAPVGSAEKSLLTSFQYLSTVSGGGYTGSWLSASLLRSDFADIWKSLIGRPEGPDKEPPVIGWLRSYSNYLTPRLGITSGDTWASIALTIRNLVLNWLVILPFVCSVILIIKLVGVGSDSVTRLAEWPALQLDILWAVIAAACLIKALAFVTRHRPSRAPVCRATQRQYLFGSLVYSVASAAFMIQFMASDYFDNLLLKDGKCCEAAVSYPIILAMGALCGVLIYGASWIAGWPNRKNLLDFVMWSASGSIYGALVGLGLYIWIGIPEEGIGIFSSVVLDIVFGIPWVLGAQILAEMIFVAMDSYQARSDDDREWLGRASGLLIAALAGWFLLTFFVFFGAVIGTSLMSHDVQVKIQQYSAPIAGLAGLVSAVLGNSSASPVTGAAKGWWPVLTNVVLSLTALVFFAALFVSISFALDQLLLGETLVPKIFEDWADPDSHVALDRIAALERFAAGLVFFLILGAGASLCININRFSLHSLYRNRLIRAFLGARSNRNPDPFTDFDDGDNPRMAELWSPAATAQWRPFHVINIALNVVTSKRLAWQERKAEPFTVSALHCGSGFLGFRPSDT